ncbi:F-box/kelch-repeat protein At3g23880-like [Rhododendron vialii]|uniref:F-box/kelch-repeat protein At3g23880-like n=1 Tax=Rhododendron vialii TaxID=182163 RepID=UPI00265ED47A|nr:F-box/kelch-repeat protein At3g23880-like [Rhododendron vialii]
MERGRGSSSSSRPRETNKTIALKSEDPNNFPNIPEEIIIDILSRLPHQSLCRLRCVSKHWSSLISDSNLISLSKRQKVIVVSQLYDGSFSFHSIDQQCSVENVQTPWEKNLDLCYTEVHIYGSCNGLFLLGIKVDLYLWNPLNGYFKKVLSYHRLTHRYLSSSVITSGLCYDSSTNGYKAVMALTPLDPCDSKCSKCVMVGNFRRKYWKEVCFPFNISSIRSGPVLNGQLHWFACNTNFLSTHSIFSFDPLVDEFKKVPMPKPSKDGDEFILLGLGVLDGCICMIRHRQCNVEVWVMEAYGVQNSWNVRFVINETFRVCSMFEPLCCTKDGKVLLREHIGYDSGHVNVYNSNGDLDRDVPRPSNCNYSMVAMAYEESLVEPIDYTWENEERRGIATYVEHFLSASSRTMTKGKDSKWHLLEDPEQEEAEETPEKRRIR